MGRFCQSPTSRSYKRSHCAIQAAYYFVGGVILDLLPKSPGSAQQVSRPLNVLESRRRGSGLLAFLLDFIRIEAQYRDTAQK